MVAFSHAWRKACGDRAAENRNMPSHGGASNSAQPRLARRVGRQTGPGDRRAVAGVTDTRIMTSPPQTRSAKRGRPGYDLESLLAVAVRLFNERGYDGTSMEDLSRKLGITKSAIYHHVPSKQELLRLAVDRALDGLFAIAEETAQRDGRAIERLEHLVRGSVLVLADRLPFVTLLLRVRGNTKVERAALAR